MHVSALPHLHQIVAWTTANSSNETLNVINENAPSVEPVRPLLWTILIAIALSTIILLTILGNILVLIALCVNFALRSPTHLLMGNLACADLLLGKQICFLRRARARDDVRTGSGLCRARLLKKTVASRVPS